MTKVQKSLNHTRSSEPSLPFLMELGWPSISAGPVAAKRDPPKGPPLIHYLSSLLRPPFLFFKALDHRSSFRRHKFWGRGRSCGLASLPLLTLFKERVSPTLPVPLL